MQAVRGLITTQPCTEVSMSTGSKVVLLLSFVFIGVLVWYYGPSSASTDQHAQV